MSSNEDTVTITVTRFQAEFLFDAIYRKERLFSTDGVHPYFHEPYIQKRAQFRDLVRQLHCFNSSARSTLLTIHDHPIPHRNQARPHSLR